MADASAATATQAGFKTIFEVDEACLEQVRALEAEFQEAARSGSDTVEFKHIQAVGRELPDGSVVRIIPGFGLQDNVPGHVMVLTLKEAVRQAMAREFTNLDFWERAETALTGAFSNLAAQEGSAHLVFRPGGDGTSAEEGTSYDYHLLFALQDEETEGFVYVVAFCVHVTVALDKEQVLKLGVEDTAPYAMRLDALCVRRPIVA